jgi:uncharacterized membrane protein YeiH
VFALSGASLAARKGFDVVGLLVLAMATGLGGGILRDVLLGDLPPVAMRHQLYLAAPIIAALVVLGGHHAVEKMWRPVLVFDAAGLGLFSVVGTAKALDHSLGILPSVLLGVTTAVGGGMLRDVLAREVPSVFRADSALYAIPAALGSCGSGDLHRVVRAAPSRPRHAPWLASPDRSASPRKIILPLTGR